MKRPQVLRGILNFAYLFIFDGHCDLQCMDTPSPQTPRAVNLDRLIYSSTDQSSDRHHPVTVYSRHKRMAGQRTGSRPDAPSKLRLPWNRIFYRQEVLSSFMATSNIPAWTNSKPASSRIYSILLHFGSGWTTIQEPALTMQSYAVRVQLDAFTTCARMRGKSSDTPILVQSTQEHEQSTNNDSIWLNP